MFSSAGTMSHDRDSRRYIGTVSPLQNDGNENMNEMSSEKESKESVVKESEVTADPDDKRKARMQKIKMELGESTDIER